MKKGFCKSSKKGLTLPVAIVISIVLVIVAAGLVFIALSSISTTTVTVNGRQAFMDVRSALEYVESYYRNKEPDFSQIGDGSGVEYFIADETTNAGARAAAGLATAPVSARDGQATVKYRRSSVAPDLNSVKTYVTAEYVSGMPSTLRLTGYSHYSDNFGHLGRSVSLSVTFTVGASGSQKRVTVVNLPNSHEINTQTDTIRLNFRKPLDLDWADVCYYVWTYKDVGGAYTGAKGLSYYDAAGNKITPNLDAINTSEKHSNEQQPNGTWVTGRSDGTNGANGTMVKQSSGWYVGEYKINGEYVNYFNIIFEKKNALLAVDKGGGNYEYHIYDTQTSEIFHLWYLNADDKNIYFEMINKKKSDAENSGYYFKYYSRQKNYNEGTKVGDWNGTDTLDDSLIIYLKNQKTTVHFRALGDNDNKLSNVLGNNVKPRITYVGNSDGSKMVGPTFLVGTGSDKTEECGGSKATGGIEMAYEGCGWWVANIETKKTFNIRISYRGVEYSLDKIRPSTDSAALDATPESWLILNSRVTSVNASERYLEAHQTETAALKALGQPTTSYVTIHAKNYEPGKQTQPKLTYTMTANSSVGRQKLRDKITEASMLVSSDYANYDATLGSGTKLLEKAIAAYNFEKFIQAPYKVDETKPDPATIPDDAPYDVEAADQAYATFINAIDTAIAALKPAKADQATVANFMKAYEAAKNIEDHVELYDYGQWLLFTSSGGTYKTAEQFYNDYIKNGTAEKADVTTHTTALNTKVSNMSSAKLDRQPLAALVEEIKAAKWTTDPNYEQSYREALATQLNASEDLSNPKVKKQVYQNNASVPASSLYHQKEKLEQALRDVKNHPVINNTLDFTELDSLVQTATDLLNSASNYTDSSKSLLETRKAEALALKTNLTATESDLTAVLTALRKAITDFTVVKPADDGTGTAIGTGMVRLWMTAADAGHKNRIQKLEEDGSVSEDVTDRYLKHLPSANLDYIDLTVNRTVAVRFSVIEKAGNTVVASIDRAIGDLTDSNTYLHMDYVKQTITAEKFTTVYVPRKNTEGKDYTTSSYIEVDSKVYGDGARALTADYFIYRYPTNPNAFLTVRNTTDGAVYEGHTGIKISGAGQYVVRLNNFDLEAVNVDDIYPKAGGAGGTGTPVAYHGDEDYRIEPMIVSAEEPEVRQVVLGDHLSSTAKKEIVAAVKELNMAEDQMCLIVHKYSGDSAFGGEAPRIWAWGGGKNIANDFDNRPSMTKLQIKDSSGNVKDKDSDGRECYYIVCSKQFTDYQVTKQGSDVVMGNSKLDNNAAGKRYDYYVIQEYSGKGDIQDMGNIDRSTPYVIDPEEPDDIVITPLEGTKIDVPGVTADNNVSCIIFKTNTGSPYIYQWTEDSDGKLLYVKNDGQSMLNYSDKVNYYVQTFTNEYDRFKITNGSGGANLIKETALPKNPSTRQLYKYYIMTATSSGGASIVNMTDDTPYIKFDYSDGVAEIEASQDDLPMAYVGGGKIRIKNKSYTETYPSGGKQCAADGNTLSLGSHWKFGGYSDTTNSEHRVGDSKLMPYYDWYEYKIPVEKSASYNFYISGIDPNHSGIRTKRVVGAYGDVWVSLYNDESQNMTYPDGTHSGFTNTEILTFDPDTYQIAQEISLYFRMPSTWAGSGNTPYVTVRGTANTEGKTVAMTQLTRQGNIWKASGISKNDPFVTFTVGSEVYKTELKGGSYICFNPLKSKPYGDWEKFESDQDKLRNACDSLLNMYYAKSVVKNYDDKGNSKDGTHDNLSQYLWEKIIDNGKDSDGNQVRPAGIYNKYFARSATNTTDPWKTSVSDTLDETVAYRDAEKINQLVGIMDELYDKMSLARSYINVPISNNEYHGDNSGGLYPEFIQRGNYRQYDGVTVLKGKLSAAEEEYLKSQDPSATTSEMAAAAVEVSSDIWGDSSTWTADDQKLLKKIVSVEKQIQTLNRAIANVKVTAEGAIAVVLYDAQNKVSLGHTFQVWYKPESKTAAVKKETITDVNPEGYPIKFITKNNGSEIYDIIYDVQFYDMTARELLGKPKSEMKKDEAWVYMDNAVGAMWRENSLTDYRIVSNDLYVEGTDTASDSNEVEFNMNKVMVGKVDAAGNPVLGADGKQQMIAKQVKVKIISAAGTVTAERLEDEYDTMTVYFKYDTTVRYGTKWYVVKAGAYDFSNQDVYDARSPVYGGVFRMFSDNAETYFTNASNYKKYTDGIDLIDLTYNADGTKTISGSWLVNNDFTTEQKVNVGSNVNIDMDRGSLANLPVTVPYSYSTNKGMYFRWSSESPLNVGGAGVKLYASEYRFGAVGTIDATQFGNSMTHFYLYDFKGGNSVKISFLTDVTVTYPDVTGYVHSFVIREGDYMIEKSYKKNAFGKTKEKTDYIADLFDEDYWKALEYVKPLNSGTSSTKKWSTGNYGLSNPEYSN